MNGHPPARRALVTLAVLALAATPGLAAAAPGGEDTGPTTAPGRIANAGEPGTISGSYLVTLAEEVPAASAAGRALVEDRGGEITSVFRHTVNGFAVDMTEAQALAVAADPDVLQVAQNQRHRAADEVQTDPPSWGLDRVDQVELPLDASYTYPSHGGEGVTAYIVDTGVRITHEEFEGRATSGFDFFDEGGVDGRNHGTHVAATVAGALHGMAKNTDIVSVRVIDSSGYATSETIVAGVDWVTGNASGPSVVNMSLGIPDDPVLDAAVSASIASGITYVVSAGNDGTAATTKSPAGVPEAITVGSADSTDTMAASSNRGPAVDFFAPGVQITSADATNDTATRTLNGTSMAAPHVTGAAALYLAEHPAATPQQVSEALRATAVTGALRALPYGTPNVLLHTGDEGGHVDVPQQPTFANDTDVPTIDRETVVSEIEVSGMAPLSGPVYMDIDIKHERAINLNVQVIAPDGTARLLCSSQLSCAWYEIARTWTWERPGFDPNGTWQLAVRDPALEDSGFIDAWALRF
ncbi:S8 family peptidase [Streptomyces marincola]|uniref:S8 family peptidase n=1 Tax=Streptomyces marincola TaxID=2878388 RepID=UPI001CF38971|nr:S8 family serine peptidase [Streptomyces marincola]UCM91249.1 S8 family peptidase [Streptomyces marincola]